MTHPSRVCIGVYVESRIRRLDGIPKDGRIERERKGESPARCKSERLARGQEGVKPPQASAQAQERVRRSGVGVAKRAEAAEKDSICLSWG